MFKFIILCCLFYSSFLFADVAGNVFSIHDGDTLVIIEKMTGKKIKVRLLGVDTPEVDFQGASQGEMALKARDYLRSIIPINAEVLVKTPEKSMDSNGRTLGQVIYRGHDINSQMLSAGWGAVYFIYPFDKKLVSEYTRAAEEAYIHKRGIFSPLYEHGSLPYVFRQEMKGLPGTNLVGDFQNKLLKNNLEDVPVFRRVFFNSLEVAQMQGYRY